MKERQKEKEGERGRKVIKGRVGEARRKMNYKRINLQDPV